MENLLFPDMMVEKPKVVNVSSVPQRSPFRYAGGKSWLIPVIRKWLKDNKNILVEPFLGGGSISLSACMEKLTELSIMVELDEEVASVWKTILSDDCDWLIEQIKKFVLEAVLISFDKFVKHDLDECDLYHGFRSFSKEFVINSQPSEVFQP